MKTEPLSEEQRIIARCRAGDWSEYGWLVNRYRRLAWAAVDSVAGDDAATADLVQETFIRVYEKLNTFRGDSRFSSWLYRLARNIAVSHLRKVNRRPRLDSLDAQPAGQPDYHSRLPDSRRPDQDYIEDARQRDLARILSELPADYRAVIDLYYTGELSYQEIAEILGLPINTVKTRLRRARQRIVESARASGWVGPTDGGSTVGEEHASD
ncbi:sigma-70 family RNA polymerase sigma factor [bacterium]|nr:sigma-70 family RNA polymerase sigma factor [bacterium]